VIGVSEKSHGGSGIPLSELNVWLDVGFTALYVLVVLALVGHFTGNVLTGRVKDHFIDKHWPDHEAPPVPVLHKALHLSHLLSMFVLGFTGLYIRFPFFDGGRTAMRHVHYLFMVVVTVGFVWRLWCAFFSRRRDYREFAITRDDVCTAPACAMYYVFVKDSKPHLCKYNVMQKVTYMLFIPLMLMQAFTGFALIADPVFFGYSPRDLLLGWWLGAFLGSSDLAGWYARTLHYVITWAFIILTTVHAYLSFTEDFPAVKDFFGFVTVPRGERCEVPGSPPKAVRGGKDQPRPSPALTETEPAPTGRPHAAARLTPMGAPPPGRSSQGGRA
jgi:Ni,Fe-hydrogenase I cytochrome b subunit